MRKPKEQTAIPTTNTAPNPDRFPVKGHFADRIKQLAQEQSQMMAALRRSNEEAASICAGILESAGVDLSKGDGQYAPYIEPTDGSVWVRMTPKQ